MRHTDKELTDDPVVLHILELLKKQGKIEKQLTDYLGLQSGTMTKIKYYGSMAHYKHLKEICEFLNTTPNYLFMGSEEDKDELTAAERKLIRMYRGFDKEKKRCIENTMKIFSENNENETKK